jgi:hypothetical protein
MCRWSKQTFDEPLENIAFSCACKKRRTVNVIQANKWQGKILCHLLASLARSLEALIQTRMQTNASPAPCYLQDDRGMVVR